MNSAGGTAALAAYQLAMRVTGKTACLLGSKQFAGLTLLPQLAQQPAVSDSVRLVHGGSLACMGYGSHMSDNDPEIIKKEKKKALTGCSPEFMPGLPGWNEKLASDSEAVIKAERTPELPIESFVEFTVVELREQEATDQGQCPANPPIVPAKAPDVQKDLEYDEQPDTMGIKPL